MTLVWGKIVGVGKIYVALYLIIFIGFSQPTLASIWVADQNKNAMAFHVGYGAADFISGTSAELRSGQNRVHLLEAGAYFASQGTHINGKLDASGAWSFSPGTSGWIWVPDAYVSTHFAKTELTFGRRRYHYSHMDESWGLGLWGPRLRWDYFEPRQNGLTGLFATTDIGPLRITALASAVSIPEITAGFDFVDGKILSKNPYAIPPKSSIEIYDVVTPIRYELERPTFADLTVQPHGALMIEIPEEPGQFWLRGAYAYKPIPNFQLSYSGSLVLGAEQIDVRITPDVRYHHLGSFEFGYLPTDRQVIGATMSVGAEVPERSAETRRIGYNGYTSQQFTRAVLFSPELTAKVYDNESGSLRLSASYLRILDGDTYDEGPLAPAKGSFFEPRFLFTDAIRPKLAWRPPGKLGRHVLSNTTFLYDRRTGFSLFSTGLDCDIARSVALGIRSDFLSIPSDSEGEYLKQYAAHDRVFVEVRYVF